MTVKGRSARGGSRRSDSGGGHARQSFANDLGDSRSLVAVTDDVNQSKGDQDPATWLPTYDRCRFILGWTAVKIRWNQTGDTTEKSSLTSLGTDVTLTVSTV